MGHIFLDANIFIDIAERKTAKILDLEGHESFISSLSVHILIYIANKKIPDSDLTLMLNLLSMVDFSSDIMEKALSGPTKDFEDNVQLHSAAKAECDLFLTRDEKLLKMQFFGETKISRDLS